MQSRLPRKLRVVPIIDALFEIRFKSNVPTSSLLPGLLFSKLAGNKGINTLPVAGLPEQLRASDPNLQYASVIRLVWENFHINIGDRAYSVACTLPYPGWTAFKATVLMIASMIDETHLLTSIERMSMKYTNVIPASLGRTEQVADFDMRLGSKDARSGLFHVRAEIPEGDMLHIAQLASNASATLTDGTTHEGTVIDIDTIKTCVPDEDPSTFFSKLPDAVEQLHHETKSMFFSLLKTEAIAKLGATYD